MAMLHAALRAKAGRCHGPVEVDRTGCERFQMHRAILVQLNAPTAQQGHGMRQSERATR
jgi:hypothetical protein